MITTAEACNRLKCSKASLNVHLRKGSFPGAERKGRVWLIPESDIVGFRVMTRKEALAAAFAGRKNIVSDEAFCALRCAALNGGSPSELVKVSGRKRHATYAILRSRGIVLRETKSQKKTARMSELGADEELRASFDLLWKQHGSYLELLARRLAPADPAALLSDGLLFMWEKIAADRRSIDKFKVWAKAVLGKIARNRRHDVAGVFDSELCIVAGNPRCYVECLDWEIGEVYVHEVMHRPMPIDEAI